MEVSALCLGTMYFGSRENAEISYQLLDRYVEAGGTFLDTANIYVRWIPGFVGGKSKTLLGHLLDLCKTEGVTMLAYSALLGGGHTRADRPVPDEYHGPDTDARLAVLKAVAEETGATPNQVVLAWITQGQPGVLPLTAASTLAQLKENIKALNLQLSAEQLDRLTMAEK